MFDFAASRPRRRPSITPMIDVVFLLLVLFMLMVRFGDERALSLETAGGDVYSGPPRLVEVLPEALSLNGVAMAPRELLLELVRISGSGSDPVVLRPAQDTSLQRLIDVMTLMEAAGFRNLSIAEARP